MQDCDFCAIGSGEVDSDLVAFRSDRVFVLPALRQRRRNRGHALVLPVGHVSNLHDAPPELLAAMMTVTSRLTAAVPDLFGATGSLVFQNNILPDGMPFHLHVHVVPRFSGDGFTMPDPSVAEVTRAERMAQAALIRRALAS
jgi:histidine triad (HIT) family protein